MPKIYVIAGTVEQARNWIRKDITNKANNGIAIFPNEYVVVTDAQSLRGVSNPRGMFVGTWRQNPNILDIVRTLMINSQIENPSIKSIWLELRPRPKKVVSSQTAAQTYQASIDAAAKRLSDAIDQQVLDQIKQDSNYTISMDQMLIPMINAIQELNTKVKALEVK